MDTTSKLHSLTEDGEIYHLRITAESNEIDALFNDEEKSKTFDEYLSYIEALPVDKFIVDRSMAIPFSSAIYPFNKIGEQFEGTSLVTAVRVSSNFYNVFQVLGDFDQEKIIRAFNDYTFGDEIPVVLGSDYKRYFKVGDIIRDDVDEIFNVVGFLKKDEYYVAPYESDKAYYLNESFIIPNDSSENNFVTLESTCFQTNEKQVLDEMIAKSEDMGIVSLQYESFTEQIAESETDILNEMMTMASVMIVIFIFASIGIISYIVRFIQTRMREFSIHMIYGASEKSILIRISMQSILMICVSIVVALIIFGPVLAVLGMAIIGLLYCLGIMIYPYITFRRLSIIDVLRGNAK
jgi:ABC-type lipoprotein release transport system permease subunit